MRTVLQSIFLFLLSVNAFALDAISANIAEKDINIMFRKALMGAAMQLDKSAQVNPFAVVIKQDDSFGVFDLPMNSKKNESLTVQERISHVRGLLEAAAQAESIRAFCQVAYIVVQQDGVNAHGLSFEIEHKTGVSMQRFVPVEVNEDTGKIHLLIEKIVTNNKPGVVFAGL